MNKVYVVLCDQAYASFTCVIGVFTDQEKAEKCAAGCRDRVIEEFILDIDTFKES